MKRPCAAGHMRVILTELDFDFDTATAGQITQNRGPPSPDKRTASPGLPEAENGPVRNQSPLQLPSRFQLRQGRRESGGTPRWHLASMLLDLGLALPAPNSVDGPPRPLVFSASETRACACMWGQEPTYRGQSVFGHRPAGSILLSRARFWPPTSGGAENDCVPGTLEFFGTSFFRYRGRGEPLEKLAYTLSNCGDEGIFG
ncbi:uncharacterized protein G6M90_00g062360 [Metarhizium brunneum]|uniref:Uncharacterized protein n=1 Tax=Metarhizium brunneum TaxID=500148 RepID=A0A7D5YV51_9HYPO|nr:hypothetical protein G6M90_00g062360 [Metarhizium brunneum]